MAQAAAAAALAAQQAADQANAQLQQQAQLIAGLQQQLQAMQQQQQAAPGGPAAAPNVGDAALAALAAAQAQTLALQKRAAAPKPSTPFAGGRPNALLANRWLVDMERYFSEGDIVSDADRLGQVPSFIADGARTWWEGLQQLPAASQITTWAAFIVAFKARHVTQIAGMEARRELDRLVDRRHTSVPHFTARFQDLLGSCADMAQMDRIHAYRKGLPEKIHNSLASKEFATVDELINAASRMAANDPSSSHATSSSSSSGGRQHRPFAHAKANNVNAEQDYSDDDQPGTPPADLVQQVALLTAQLHRLSSYGGKPGNKQGKNRKPSQMIAGLGKELVAARVKNHLCVKCGQGGHWKNECKNPADTTTQPK